MAQHYVENKLRLDAYQAITENILADLRKNLHLCVVLYGHPTVFAKPGLDAIRQAKNEGYNARVLPGISAEACLFADLLIDPGSCGCLSIEATDLLIHQKRIDPSCHLILWQADMIGVLGNPSSHDNRRGMAQLVEYLSKHYIQEQDIVLYEAAQYPTFEPRVEKTSLAKLPNLALSGISTLYLPPAKKAACHYDMLVSLNINPQDLKLNSE